jgi:hypothetical protein
MKCNAWTSRGQHKRGPHAQRDITDEEASKRDGIPLVVEGWRASREEEQKTDSRSEGEREEAQNTSSFSTTLLAGSGLVCYGTLSLPFVN